MKHFKFLAIVAAAFMFFSCGKSDEQPAGDTTPVVQEPADNIYQFKVLAGNGDSVPLSIYEGQVLLVVNTATQCGYTPQYEDLERMYQTYKDQGFTILDFPCNQFNNQAPGSYDDIHGYCTDHYNITFPQFAKINVNGSYASPLYVWLKSKKPGNIPWNFTKFVINRQGEVVDRFDAQTSTMNAVEASVQNQLNL